MSAQVMTGEIRTAAWEDGIEREPYCGLEDCECPDHDGPPPPAGTYITIRLDEDWPVGLWRVEVRAVPADTTGEAE